MTNTTPLSAALDRAIAKDRASARIADGNGFWEVRDNPITKVGIFPYLGSSIPGADPTKTYRVYRPASELSSPEFLDSLRLIPFIDEHEMLGPEAIGATPAEKKGVSGVIGEQVVFDGRYVRSNLRVYSEVMKQSIDAGKVELSLGYQCVYDMTPGVFDGQVYDAIQRDLRANHLALVGEGRMGPDVAVLDHGTDRLTITADSLEYNPMSDAAPDTKPEPTLAEVVAMFEGIRPMLEQLAPLIASMKPQEEPEVDAAPPTENPDAPPAMDAEKFAAMDAKIKALEALKPIDEAALKKAIAQDAADKLALYERLKLHVGVFDHAAMTHSDVAAYGVEKLGLTAPKGNEAVALDMYLRGLEKSVAPAVVADQKPAAPLAAYINGEKE